AAAKVSWYASAMLRWAICGFVFLFEGGVTWLSVQRFEALGAAEPLLETGQLSILFALCLSLSLPGLILGLRKPRYAFPFFLAKGLCLVFILMVAPRLDLGILPFYFAFNATLAVGLNAAWALIIHGIVFSMVTAMASVFHLRLGIDPTDLPLLILSGLLLVALSVMARRLFEKWEEMRANEMRLADDVVKLITINMDLQTFATTVENRTLDEERKRISREIHDTVGYTLTTLKLLFEAAKGLLSQDPAQLEPLMNQGLSYTRNSLEEIRVAMRGLRQSELPARTGLHLVVKLVDNFRSVTHMAIALEFSGTRQSYGHEIDEFLYKGVQENLTNAYRHGKATTVSIFIQESQGELALMVRDNGQAARNFVKGIGMRGMEERAAALGGTVEFVGTDYGFDVTARIPAAKREEL
ncbi:MAG: histidine kinase, partial [Treponemataceae bacterium]